MFMSSLLEGTLLIARDFSWRVLLSSIVLFPLVSFRNLILEVSLLMVFPCRGIKRGRSALSDVFKLLSFAIYSLVCFSICSI